MTEQNPHARFANYWEKLGKPQLEFKTKREPESGFLRVVGGPIWGLRYDYRIAGDRHWELRRKFVESDFKLAIEFLNGSGFWQCAPEPLWSQDVIYREAPTQPVTVVLLDAFAGDSAAISLGFTPDPGAHYRYTYRVNLSETDKANGFVDVKLDPARIAYVYRMDNMMQEQALKKVLCAGNRGHKDFNQDIKDIRCALDRWEEMLKEDGKI